MIETPLAPSSPRAHQVDGHGVATKVLVPMFLPCAHAQGKQAQLANNYNYTPVVNTFTTYGSLSTTNQPAVAPPPLSSPTVHAALLITKINDYIPGLHHSVSSLQALSIPLPLLWVLNFSTIP